MVFLFLCLTHSQVWGFEHPVYRLDLQECIDMALRNNEEIKAMHYDVYASLAKKIEATKRYVPVVKYHYRFAPVPRDLDNPSTSFLDGDVSVYNTIKLEAGVPLTTFGRISVNRELADLGIDASQLQKQRKADEVVLDIYKLYNGLLLARELTVLAEKGLEAVDKKIKEQETQETTDQLQILKLKIILYQIEKKLDEADKKAAIAKAMLKFRVGLEDDADFEIKGTYLKRDYFNPGSYDSVLEKSKQTRPEYELLSYQVQAEAKRLQLKKKEYYPKLLLGAFFEYGISPGIRGDEDDNNFNNPFNFTKAGIGLELAGDLDFRKLKANFNEQKALHLKAIADKRAKYRLLDIDVKNAYLDLDQKKKLLERVEKEKRSARQIVFLTKSNWDIGLGDKKDYLDALQSYLLIQATVFENMFYYNVAVATLKSKIGALYKADKVHRYPVGLLKN